MMSIFSEYSGYIYSCIFLRFIFGGIRKNAWRSSLVLFLRFIIFLSVPSKSGSINKCLLSLFFLLFAYLVSFYNPSFVANVFSTRVLWPCFSALLIVFFFTFLAYIYSFYISFVFVFFHLLLSFLASFILAVYSSFYPTRDLIYGFKCGVEIFMAFMITFMISVTYVLILIFI